MINNYLADLIKANLPYTPTAGQESALAALADFLTSSRENSAFILRGYAGTGKTSLVGALVRTLDKLGRRCILLAPTGRAAKVFAAYAGHSAFTIHKKVYRQREFSGEMSGFVLNDNLSVHTLYLVDEASMIANDGLSGMAFGSGRLLDDLVTFVYSGKGCRLMLVGDTAQLPPVGEEESPALCAEVLRGYGMEVGEAELTQVVRQGETSGILWNATLLRHLITGNVCKMMPKLKVTGFADIKVITAGDVADLLETCYSADGVDETIVICRSNRRANIYNEGIRSRILWREDELEAGDMLMVAKNNYYWSGKDMDFIANGEAAMVRRVKRTRSLYGFRFADVLLAFPDCGDMELEVTILLDTLRGNAPALPREDNDRLFHAVLEDYMDISLKKERMKKIKSDPHYNALQVKYAYAVTCHKAQGGQWKNVFLDAGCRNDEYPSPDYLRWLYTAFTRATGTLYLINYPSDLLE